MTSKHTDNLKPVTGPDDDLVQVGCDCGNTFDIPWDCSMFLDSLDCGQCGKSGYIEVKADPSPSRVIKNKARGGGDD